MSETDAIQEEEREVLSSIYEGDQCFKQITTNTFQYKYGENDTNKSFLLEVKWGENYPNVLPDINLDAFYNKHVMKSLQDKIVNVVITEAEQYIGTSMTYSLFEFVKEKFDELIEDQSTHIINPVGFDDDQAGVEKLTIVDNELQDFDKKVCKKEQLTKAQKRRQWNRLDSKGEKPRGWNWVDIVKHLSQTGSKDAPPPTS